MGVGGKDFQQVVVLGVADPHSQHRAVPQLLQQRPLGGSDPSRSTAAMNEDPVAIARAVIG
jgi:hypothetical protein